MSLYPRLDIGQTVRPPSTRGAAAEIVPFPTPGGATPVLLPAQAPQTRFSPPLQFPEPTYSAFPAPPTTTATTTTTATAAYAGEPFPEFPTSPVRRVSPVSRTTPQPPPSQRVSPVSRVSPTLPQLPLSLQQHVSPISRTTPSPPQPLVSQRVSPAALSTAATNLPQQGELEALPVIGQEKHNSKPLPTNTLEEVPTTSSSRTFSLIRQPRKLYSSQSKNGSTQSRS